MKLTGGDIFRVLAGIVLAAVFLLWGTAGKFWAPFIQHFPTFHILFVLCVAIAFVPAVRRGAAALWGRVVPRRYILFPAVAFVVTLLLNLLVFQGLPHIQDSVHSLFMADLLAHGRLDHPMHPYYEFFRYLYLIPDGEKIYSLFLPGFSFLLVPYTLLGIPFLANPLLTAANVALAGRIAEDLFRPRVAAAAMALAVSSSFLMVMGGTFMTHPLCAFLTLLALFCFLRARATGLDVNPRGSRALILSAVAGSALGWLLFTRPQNALFLALPLALAILYEIRWHSTFARALALTAAFLPWVAALLLYNYSYTHDLFTLRQTTFFNYSEPNDDCFGLGLGRGCPNADWMVLPDEGLTPSHAALVTYHRLSLLLLNTFAHPLFFLLVPLAFFLRRGMARREGLLAAVFLAGLVGYFFYYFDGNVFGPRYYYETTFPLVILAARGLSLLAERIAAARRPVLFMAPLSGFFGAAYLFSALFVLPPLFSTYRQDFWGVKRSLSDAVEKADIHNAVVFVDHEELIGSGLAVMRHDDWDKNDVIYVRDLGDRPDSALVHYYRSKGRLLYRAFYENPFSVGVPPIIAPIDEPDLPAHYIVAEMEDKRYPLKGEPDYCNEYPNRVELSRHVSFPPPEKLGIGFSKYAFFCRFRDPDEHYTFGQNILVPGRYSIEFVGVTGPEMGRFRVSVDDRFAGTLDFTGARYEKVSRTVEADLAAGFRFIRLEPEDRSRDTYFLIDLVEFFTRPREP